MQEEGHLGSLIAQLDTWPLSPHEPPAWLNRRPGSVGGGRLTNEVLKPFKGPESEDSG